MIDSFFFLRSVIEQFTPKESCIRAHASETSLLFLCAGCRGSQRTCSFLYSSINSNTKSLFHDIAVELKDLLVVKELGTKTSEQLSEPSGTAPATNQMCPPTQCLFMGMLASFHKAIDVRPGLAFGVQPKMFVICIETWQCMQFGVMEVQVA